MWFIYNSSAVISIDLNIQALGDFYSVVEKRYIKIQPAFYVTKIIWPIHRMLKVKNKIKQQQKHTRSCLKYVTECFKYSVGSNYMFKSYEVMYRSIRNSHIPPPPPPGHLALSLAQGGGIWRTAMYLGWGIWPQYQRGGEFDSLLTYASFELIGTLHGYMWHIHIVILQFGTHRDNVLEISVMKYLWSMCTWDINK